MIIKNFLLWNRVRKHRHVISISTFNNNPEFWGNSKQAAWSISKKGTFQDNFLFGS